jgi:hypothetical protein
MEYKIGQAVIISDAYLALVNYKHLYGIYGFKPLLGNNETFDKHESSLRPATAAEILAEIQKHGWEKDEWHIYSSPLDYFELRNKINWEWISFPPTIQANLKEYCEEGLQAHTIITALNLANV